MTDSATYRIADRLFTVEGGQALRLLSAIEGFGIFRTDTPQREWVVRVGESLPAAGFSPLTDFDFADGEAHCHFGSIPGGYAFFMTDRDSGAEVFRLHYRGTSSADAFIPDTSHPHMPDFLRFGLWMAFSLFGAPLGILPVHSSVVVHKGQSVLFLGESGTGKSTHSRLWLDTFRADAVRLLNDDSPILSVSGPQILVHGSPWSGKTPCYHNRSFPLLAAVRLEQHKSNIISRLSPLEAFSALYPSCPPALMYDELHTDRIVSAVSAVVSAVPLYRLQCLPDADAARLCRKTIFNDL